MIETFIILLPLFGAVLIGLTGLFVPAFRSQKNLIGIIASAAVFIPFFILLSKFLSFDAGNIPHFTLWNWIESHTFQIKFSYRLDQLSLLMGMIVTGIGGLIHLYSIGYMHKDEGFYKYFAYLNLFIFAMNNLVMGDNLVVLFLGWEGVGVCSYLLIGFWYEKKAYSQAAVKAFVMNRIGDFAVLIALFMIFREVGSLNFVDIQQKGLSTDIVAWVALLLFIGATGKSAQIPLFTWLPDAMAGPTPVSALIHAATMVTAGIYLIAKMSFIYVLAPQVNLLIAGIGAVTAIFAASTAIAQNDIKKVLAYSTVSQLGFMFLALGAGAYTTAIFHVMTHAFFKACLFLGSGSVIHAMEHTHAVKDPQDIRAMGGLAKYMPATRTTFWISTLAIAGIPPLAGFFSKDEILGKTFAAGHEHILYYFFWFIAIVTALLTAFYMTRLAYLTFEGKPRFDAEHHPPHESPAIMTVPLWILAVLAVLGGFLGLPEGLHLPNWIGEHWLKPATHNISHHADMTIEIVLIILSVLIGVFGVLYARNLYRNKGLEADAQLERSFGKFYKVWQHKYYIDELYESLFVEPYTRLSRGWLRWIEDNVIDGAVKAISKITELFAEYTRKLQTGQVSNYALYMVLGMLIILSYLMFN
jgi:NADH-quinone oxidoreductase subunit L